MNAVYSSFIQMLLFVRRDKMLLLICFTPLLAGLCFKFGVPAVEHIIMAWIGDSPFFTQYYGVFDVFFSMLTPVMFCFITAMVVLEEHDDHITFYLFTTTLGRKGYLISRILIPAVLAALITMILFPIFKLTSLSILEMVVLSIMGSLQGIIIALLVVTLSTNKLEGMAVAKLSTLTILGALIPYVVSHPIQYFACFLPSFWFGKAIYDVQMVYILPSILLAILWIYLLLRKFLKKFT